MATNVLRRTIFVERAKDGVYRFADWAMVVTPDGTMVEPFAPNVRQTEGADYEDFDPTDDMTLVTEIKEVDFDMLPTLLSGGGPVWVGGVLMPRTGR